VKAFKMAQATDHWWEVRRGIPTSSSFDKIITAAKGDLSAQADDLIAELIGDIVMQTPNYFSSRGLVNTYAMQQGVETEPEARRWYALEANTDVAEVGFVMDDDFRFGCSPDGLIGFKVADQPGGQFNGHEWYEATADAALELKCPLLKTQARYLMDGGLPKDYRPQVHGHLIVCGTAYGEFVSYAHGLTPLRIRVEADDYTAKVRKALDGFWEKFQTAKKKLLP